jgi:ribosomal protein S18 acetylase RimI-like enzyme
MITVEPITSRNIVSFRDVRLRALLEDPYGFSATYAQECQLSADDWVKRAERWNGEKGIGLLAIDGDTACGIVGAFLDEEDPKRAQLISMWTAPTHRERGVGRLLVDEVARWAHGREACVLQLMVTSVNHGAMGFYERLGFTPTGRTSPYPNDLDVIEYEMARPIPWRTRGVDPGGS